MEWVETTAKTVEEARELALDRLGVDEQEAEFEVVERARPGLFGRMRGEARVRARVQPTQPRPKVERRDRKRVGGKGRSGGRAAAAPSDAPAAAAELPRRARHGDAVGAACRSTRAEACAPTRPWP